MPPWNVIWVCNFRRNVDSQGQENPNWPEVQPYQRDVTYVKFRNYIHMQAQVVENHIVQQGLAHQDMVDTSSIADLL